MIDKFAVVIGGTANNDCNKLDMAQFSLCCQLSMKDM